jgi:hypothetical protein
MTAHLVNPLWANIPWLDTDWLIEREAWTSHLMRITGIDRDQAVTMINDRAKLLPRKLEYRDVDEIAQQLLEIYAPLPHRTVSLARINHHWRNQ